MTNFHALLCRDHFIRVFCMGPWSKIHYATAKMNLKPFNLLVLRIDLNKNAYTEKLPFFSILRNVIRESFSSWKYDRHICQGFFRLHNTDWAAAAAWWMTLVKIVSASILHLGNGDNWYHYDRDTVISCKLSDLINLFLIPIKVMTMNANDNVTMLQCHWWY